MKFDVIIGNPPYQLDTAGHGRQAKPIYQNLLNSQKVKSKIYNYDYPKVVFWWYGLDDFRKYA